MEICSCRMTKTATVFYSSQGNLCKRKQKYRNKKDKGGDDYYDSYQRKLNDENPTVYILMSIEWLKIFLCHEPNIFGI